MSKCLRTTEVLCVLFLLSFLFIIYPQSALAQEEDEEFLDLIEYRTFRFFYENTDERGFTIESTAWPIGSSASSGFYLTSIPIAIERGWISYNEGYQLVNTTLNNYYDDPEDPDDFYVESEHGFFPHWFYQETGKWNEVDCFSSIDTAILMAGVLTVRQYFADTEVENVATKLYENVDWEWMLNGDDALSMGWEPDKGFLPYTWEGYNEGMLAVLLAMGSPTHPIPEESWDAWTRTYKQVEYQHGNQRYKFVESSSTSLFTYQYPHIWFDFRGKTDKRGVNYFQNSVNATLENRAYCIENQNNHTGYGKNVWGLTASECPLHDSSYGAHGPRQNDDGTIAPTGAGGSIIFTPIESIEALRYIKENYEYGIWGKYGFKDSFNLDIDYFSPTYIGIDQGAILTMVENYRTGLVQNLFMQNGYTKVAMQKAGFTDVDTTPPTITEIKKHGTKVIAKVTDNAGVKSVSLHMSIIITPGQKGSNSRPLRGWVRPTYSEVTEEMNQEGKIYSANLPDDRGSDGSYQQVTSFYLEAIDINGNVVSSRKFKLPMSEEGEVTLLPDTPNESLLVDRFDDCISGTEAGAWHGGSSTTKDCVIAFYSSVNRDETGCSMKVRYNVEKKGAYNGAWIRLGNLDLREYDELIFWVKGDEKEGYTTTFKIELNSPKGSGEYIVDGVTNSWKEIAVPLTAFKTSSGASGINWSNVTEFTLVFEDWRATNKDGVIYIDDIYFTLTTSKLTPTQTPISTPIPTPTPGIPGFEAVLAITGLLVKAYLVRRRK